MLLDRSLLEHGAVKELRTLKRRAPQNSDVVVVGVVHFELRQRVVRRLATQLYRSKTLPPTFGQGQAPPLPSSSQGGNLVCINGGKRILGVYVIT